VRVIDDSVKSLQTLAEMHRRGDLSDAEFAEAKRALLEPVADAPATAQPTPAPDPLAALTPSEPRRSDPRVISSRPARAGFSLAGRWKLAIIATVVLGFVLGIALLIIAEVAPSTAQWTKGFVCSSGQQLVTNGGVVHSNGGSAQGATHFYCAPTGQPVTGFELLSLPEKTGAVLGLSVLFGFVIAAMLSVIGVVVLSLRSRARATTG
jgi:Short C-terminal domain